MDIPHLDAFVALGMIRKKHNCNDIMLEYSQEHTGISYGDNNRYLRQENKSEAIIIMDPISTAAAMSLYYNQHQLFGGNGYPQSY